MSNNTINTTSPNELKQKESVELASLILTNPYIGKKGLKHIKDILGDDYEKLKSLKKGLSSIKNTTSQTVDILIDGNTQALLQEEILSQITQIKEKYQKEFLESSGDNTDILSLEEFLESNPSSTIDRVRELYSDETTREHFLQEVKKRQPNLDRLNIGKEHLQELLKIDKLIKKANEKILEIRVKSFKTNTPLSPKEVSFINTIRSKIKEEELKRQNLLQKQETTLAYRSHTLKDYKKQLNETGFVLTPSRQKLIDEIIDKVLVGQNVLLPGPTGTGKTVLAVEAVRQISQFLGKEPIKIDGKQIAKEVDNFAEVFSGTSDARPSDFIAKIKLVEGKHGGTETKTELGKLLKAFVEGKIPIIDEIDLIPNDVLMRIKHLFTLKPGSLYSPQENGQEKYTLQTTSIIATANIKSDKHSDREDLDPAIVRLFDTLHISYLPKEEIYDITLVNLMEQQGFVYGVGVEEFVGNKSIFLSLINSLKKIEENYLGTGEGENISNKSKQYLKKAILETGKFMRLFAGYKESGQNINDFIHQKIIDFTTNTAYPKNDRLILIKIFSTDGLLSKLDIPSLLSKMDDISEQELEQNILTGDFKFSSSDLPFVDEYELASFDPYDVRKINSLESFLNPAKTILQEIDAVLLSLGDSKEKEALGDLILDILTEIEQDETYEINKEQKEDLLGYLYELEQVELLEKLGSISIFEELYETIKIADKSEYGKNILGGLIEKNKILEKGIETTNTFPKQGMTPRDIEVMEEIKSRDEDKFNKLMEVLEYGDDHIQIRLPKAGILKIDREDLGRMTWQQAMDKAEELGKRLMTIEELEELPDFVGLEDCREIFNLEANNYWSSTTDAINTDDARILDFGGAGAGSGSKTDARRVICTR